MRRFTIIAFCIVLAGSMILCLAASPSIGMVIARGGFQIDSARVSGNATLFDGTVVQTGRSAGELELNSGTRVEVNGSVDAAATPAQPASQVVNVQTVSQVATGAAAAGVGAGAGAAAGTATAAGATSAGVSVGTVAIVGGVAAAGTVTG